MNIDVITKIAGVLGFIISVSTFVLTRYERRKIIEIDLSDSTDSDFVGDRTSPKEMSLIKVRFINLGQKSVILKPDTLKIEYQGQPYYLCGHDYWGDEEFEELMPPNSTRVIGVDLKSVLTKFNIKPPKGGYDYLTINKLFPLTVSVLDHSGKKYKTSKYRFHEASGQFITGRVR